MPEPWAAPAEPAATAERAPAGTAERAPADDRMLRELYLAHGSALMTFLLRQTRGDRHRAEDILQETLLRAWRHRETLSTEVEVIRAWLYTVARNVAIDQVRAQRSRPVELRDDFLEERPDPDNDVERMINLDEMRAAIAALPDRLREIIIEIYVMEHSVGEVAARLGIPPGTVKSRTFYALRAMRRSMERRRLPPPTGR